MSHTHPHGRPAYIEDFNEEENTALPDTRQTANVAAKRSKPDSPKAKSVRKVKDELSDSGYSSHAAATINNGRSSHDPKGGNAPASIAPVRTISKRRPAVEKRSESTPRVQTKAPAQAGDSKNIATVRHDAECSWCAARGRGSVKPEHRRPSKHSPPKHASPAEHGAPSGPSAAIPIPARPNPEMQQIRPRARAATTQSNRPTRPLSFHAGLIPQPLYIQPMYPERPYASGYPTVAPLPMASYPPPSNPYFPPPPQPRPPPPDTYSVAPLPYEFSPPSIDGQWTVEPNRHLRNSIMYNNIPRPLEYTQQPHYTTIAPPQPVTHQNVRPQDRPPPRIEKLNRTSDRYLMPPPPPPPPHRSYSQNRPEMRHAKTTSLAHPTLHRQQSDHGEELVRVQSSDRRLRKVHTDEHNTSKRPPLATIPSYGPGDEKPSTQHSEPTIKHEKSTKERRRVSYYGHETPRELERKVEAYQASHGASARTEQPFPLTESALKLVRKKTHSDTASRASGDGKASRGGSSVKSRASIEHKKGSDAKVRPEKDDGVRMRFNASQGVNVDFKGGGVDGRTISLRQSGDRIGEMELSIGSKDKRMSDRETHMAEKERHMRDREEMMGIRSKRYSYAGGEAEISRSGSRVRKEMRAIDDRRERELRSSNNRSRRSSRSGYSGKAFAEQY